MRPAHPPPETTGAEQLLFTPGPRLGWIFRDRRELAIPFPEPQPSPQAIHAQAAAGQEAAEQAWRRAWKWIGMPSALVAAMVIFLEGCGQLATGQFSLGTVLTALVPSARDRRGQHNQRTEGMVTRAVLMESAMVGY